MKKIYKYLLIIFVLVFIDQFAKIVIYNYYDFDEALMQVKDTVHIHPRMHYKAINKCVQLAEKTGLSVSFWFYANSLLLVISDCIFNSFIYVTYKFFDIAHLKTRKTFVGVLLVLLNSGAICSVLDRLLWGGTLDFMCISKTFTSDLGNLKILHITQDVKDCYLDVSFVLFCIYAVLVAIDFSKLKKDKEKYIIFKRSLKSKFIKNIINKRY